jgi:hypothetical protein
MNKFGGAIVEHVPPMSNQHGGMTTIEDKIIFPNGCYEFLPEFEEQASIFFESNTCVSQSYNNALETEFSRDFKNGKISKENLKWLQDEGYFKNGKINFNDRALAIISGTDPNGGNSGECVADAAEAYGLAAESAWPWDWNEPDPNINSKKNYWNNLNLPEKVKTQMAEFHKRFELMHEWVERNDWAEAEKKGALQGYVNAWHEKNGKYYNPAPGSYNHAVQSISEATIEIFDTYLPEIKQLEKITDIHSWMLKVNFRECSKIMPKIANNTLIFTTGHGGQFGLYLDNRIIIDDLAKIQAMAIMRSKVINEGTENEQVLLKRKTLTESDWDLFPKTNLKNEKI